MPVIEARSEPLPIDAAWDRRQRNLGEVARLVKARPDWAGRLMSDGRMTWLEAEREVNAAWEAYYGHWLAERRIERSGS